MSTDMIPFDFDGQPVRTSRPFDDEPWFVVADVCRVLGLSNPSAAIARLDDDDLSSTEVIDSMCRRQLANITNESGLYGLIFLSRKDEAKRFKRWVTSEVLPALRRTGSYSGMPQDYPSALRALAAEVEEKQALAARNAELEDAAEGYRHFIETDGTVKWRNACEHLGVAPNLFGAYLRDQKVLFTGGERHNRPYAQYAHWFAFPAYEAKDPAKLERVPEAQRYDRRVTDAGMDGLRRALKRHVVGCGDCTMCKSLRLSKPDIFATWRAGTITARGEAS